MEHSVVEFVSRSYCLLGQPELIWPAFIGDVLFALAYLAIPLILWGLTRKYHFNKDLRLIFWVFSTFIILCGFTHVTDSILMWYADPILVFIDAWLRVIGGTFSVISAVITLHVARKFLIFMGTIGNIAIELRDQKERDDLIREETWNKYLHVMSEVKQFLKEKESIIEE